MSRQDSPTWPPTVVGWLEAGRVVPAPDGPRVEQVGWGVARQVARSLHAELEAGLDAGLEAGLQVGLLEAGLLDAAPDLAERAGHAAYACFVPGRPGVRAAGIALLRTGEGRSRHLGQVLAAVAPGSLGAAFLARMLHDAGRAGSEVLDVPALPFDLEPWGLRPLSASPERPAGEG